MNELF